MIETTFAMIKPDAVKNRDVGRIIDLIEKANINIVGMELSTLEKSDAEFLYHQHEGKPYYSSLIEFTLSGPVVLLVLQFPNVIQVWRDLMGPTDSSKAEAGTIRHTFGNHNGGELIKHNAVHGSDSVETAEREIKYFFPTREP